jgi:hypothetical protein
MSDAFIEVDVEPGPAHEDGVSLRFKRTAGGVTRAITWVNYESDDGLEGRWSVLTAHTPDGPFTPGATAAQVDDSSDGTVWLITGGAHGLAGVDGGARVLFQHGVQGSDELRGSDANSGCKDARHL